MTSKAERAQAADNTAIAARVAYEGYLREARAAIRHAKRGGIAANGFAMQAHILAVKCETLADLLKDPSLIAASQDLRIDACILI